MGLGQVPGEDAVKSQQLPKRLAEYKVNLLEPSLNVDQIRETERLKRSIRLRATELPSCP